MKVWHNSGENTFYYGLPTDQSKQLEVGVYNLCWDVKKDCFFLSLIQPEFQFNMVKLYNFDDGFVNHVTKTYENTNGNMGVLLSGIKGCGKTVSAKQICRKLKLPVILIPRGDWNGMPSFFSEIKQDLILFIDEFEKTFDTTVKQERLLSLMDGAYSDKYRRLFLLTTNTMEISTNLLQRPGRVRYVKKYAQLELNVIEEVINDRLKYPEFKSSLLQFFAGLSLLTIDVVTALIDEVNIHKMGPESFGAFFNVIPGFSNFSCYKIDPKTKEKEKVTNFGSVHDPTRLIVGDHLGGTVRAYIKTKNSDLNFTMERPAAKEEFELEFVSKPYKNKAFKKKPKVSSSSEGGGGVGEKDMETKTREYYEKMEPAVLCGGADPVWDPIEASEEEVEN